MTSCFSLSSFYDLAVSFKVFLRVAVVETDVSVWKPQGLVAGLSDVKVLV